MDNPEHESVRELDNSQQINSMINGVLPPATGVTVIHASLQ